MTKNISSATLLLAISLLFLLGGCATPPRQELQKARMSVALAAAAGAQQFAPEPYQKAANHLKKGESLVREGKYSLAREILSRAESDGRRALLKSRQEQAKQELRARESEVQPTKAEPAPPPKKKRKKSVVSVPPPPPPKPAPSPAPPAPLPTRYTVTEGETRWTIASRREIYFDSLLWPLIYQANRDQIKDPRQIYPGQVLSIPRDTSEAEKEEAREKARKSDIFPVKLLMKNNPSDAP
jgi:nucleoid-associated protein YgaU